MRVLGSLAIAALIALPLPLRSADAQAGADSARPVSPAAVQVAMELLEVTRAYEVMRATMRDATARACPLCEGPVDDE